MKITKYISAWAIALAMALSQVPVMAAEAASMEAALVEVKGKVEIPAELTEFSSEVTSYNSETNYRFEWNEKDGYKSLVISCDTKGRVKDYYRYGERNSEVYIGVTLDEARAEAEDFLRHTAPEAFANENDCYVYEDGYCNYYSSNVSYVFVFSRYHNSDKVAYNDATVEVDVYGDESVIRSVRIGYDYDAVFENAAEEITEAEAVYKETFPLEMIYTDYMTYNAKKESEDEIYLAYRIADGGYISAYTGEAVEEPINTMMNTNAVYESAATADMAAGYKAQLSDSELAQIEQVGSLISESESINYLKSLPHTRLAGMEVAAQVSGLHETDRDNGEYTRYFEFDEALGDRYIYATVDAVRGRLIYYNDGKAYRPYAVKENEDAGLSAADNAKTDEFLSAVAGDIMDEFELEKEAEQEQGRRYKRVVNGVNYVQDSIYVCYDTETDAISNYSLTYNNHAEFVSPAQAIDAQAAYNALLKEEPLERAYVKLGEEYKLVYYLMSEPLINAITGERLSRNQDTYTPNEEEYTDISSHWVKDKANFLKEIGIAFEGTQLKPDAFVTQAELLRILKAGADGGWYMEEDTDSIYRYAENEGLLKKEDRNDTAPVTRETAFKYMVCFMGYDSVAKLPDIYKVSYADGEMLSEGMTGYAAILSGFGIINGDGSTIRPQDNITRAEALSVVYNYLTSPLR